MDIVVVAEVPAYKQAPKQNEVGAVRPGGTIVQHLLGDDAPDGLNFRFLRSQFQPGSEAYATPRHHHAFQQLRLSDAGTHAFSPDRAQVAWSRNAWLRIEGTTYPELTFVYSRRDEQVEISSDANGLELYLVEFPRLD